MGMAMDMDAFYGGSVISPRLREKYGCGAMVAQVFEKENKVRLDVESAFAESREITYCGGNFWLSARKGIFHFAPKERINYIKNQTRKL